MYPKIFAFLIHVGHLQTLIHEPVVKTQWKTCLQYATGYTNPEFPHSGPSPPANNKENPDFPIANFVHSPLHLMKISGQ